MLTTRRARLLAVAFSLLFPLASPARPASAEGQNILILHAFEANMPINVMTSQGLMPTLEAGGLGVQSQFFEHLDLARNPGSEHRRDLAELMGHRYRNRRIDLIITLYPEALQFVLNEGQALFSDAPVLALYLPPALTLPKTDRQVIRHSLTLDLRGTLAAALQLLPDARRVWVVSDVHPRHKMYEAQAHRDFKEWEGRLEFRYLSDRPLDDILATVAGAPPGTIVLYIAVLVDVTGKVYNPLEIAQRLSRESRAPVFGLFDIFLGRGIVGGSLASFEQTGVQAGRLALDLLRDPGRLERGPVVLEVAPRPMFDGRQMRRWGLSLRALPLSSVIVNRELSLWDLRYYLIGGLAFIVAEGFLIVVLLAQRRRRARAETALRASEALRDGILASLPGTMAVVDRAGTVVEVNRAWRSLATPGRPEDATSVRVNIEDLKVSRQRDPVARQVLDGIDSVLTGAQTEFHLDYPIGAPGVDRWVSVTVSPLKRPEGGAVILYLDITSQKRAEMEAEHLRRDLTYLSRVSTMGQLTASLAHELIQPLTAIVSNAQAGERYLTTDASAVADVRELLADVTADAKRAGEVIRRIRSLLQKTEFEFVPLDLDAVIREVAMLARTDAIIRKATIAVEVDPDLPPARGDRVQLQQVFLNLILNGLEAMEGTPVARRSLVIRATRTASGAILVGVRDAGTGIGDDQLGRVFTPFFTSKSTGLGMGLAITKSIIEAHGGTIWAENNQTGSGATLWFTLPVGAPSEASVSAS
ncbi:MAG TPA: ATP-binding protein [Methylomirabilota bacterium]|nr:ATP-binding protein [Methylomirabilota bacterium]